MAAALSDMWESNVNVDLETEMPQKPSVLVPPDGSAATQTLAEWLNRSKATPLIKKCLMEPSAAEDALDIILSALERFPWHNWDIAEEIKKGLDQRLGAAWHVVVGAAYSSEIEFESEQLIYLFYGSLAITAWKCGTVLMADMCYQRKAI